MKTREELIKATVGPDNGADFSAVKSGFLALVTPLHPAAKNWLAEYADSEARWVGDALAVELRYFPALADAIIDAGMCFERDAWVH